MPEFCSLDGKTALVTGASRGIGKAIALELASAGASVTVGYRGSQEEGEAVAQEAGGRAVRADVSDADQARALVEQAGELDLLVNNAGVTRDGLLARMPDEDWRTVMETNLSGMFFTCRAAARGMMKRRAGSIVNVSSIVGLRGAGFNYDGFFYVKSVSHSIKKGEYKQRFSLTREGVGALTPVVLP